MDISHQEHLIILGTLGSAYGIHGWLKIHTFTENSIINYQPWLIQRNSNWCRCLIESWEQKVSTLVVKFVGIDGRESAQRWTNAKIAIEAKQLPTLPAGDYYWYELIGCQVKNSDGCTLGRVASIIETGANDVLVVKPYIDNASSSVEHLIPFIDGLVIRKINIGKQLIEVNWNLLY